MQRKQHLFIPGPTPVPAAVTAAMARSMVGHRGSEYASLQLASVHKLKQVFQTENDILVMACSGTGALEAAVTSAVGPGDMVLALTTGNFGNRFADIAEQCGAEVERLEFPWGQPVDIEAVREALTMGELPRAVLMTHNETSTGVLNDVAAVGELVKDLPVLLMVDAVSSMGAVDIRTDEWAVDFMITSSQKALMLPPGLAFVAVSEAGWQAAQETAARSYYFNLLKWREHARAGSSPWTPAVSLVFGLEQALDLLLCEGLENIWRRHQRLAGAVRVGLAGMGLELVAADSCASPTVTAAYVPSDLSDDLRAAVKRDYGLWLGGGQGQLAGRIIRMSHMGHVDELEILGALAVIELGLARLGQKIEFGAGVGQAQVYLNKEG